MSSLADKASPAKFMAFGLICCAIINIFMSFADSLAFFLVLVVLNGFFQGFGVGPSFITLANGIQNKNVVALGQFGISPIILVAVS